MSIRVFVPCLRPYCSQQAERDGYCRQHAAQLPKRSRHEAGYDYTWVKFRRVYLTRHPLCVRCLSDERVTAATEIHHRRELRDYPELRFEEENLEALCKSCHSRETNRKKYAK
jgi:5-methylcytosine-specific restriction protein A